MYRCSAVSICLLASLRLTTTTTTHHHHHHHHPIQPPPPTTTTGQHRHAGVPAALLPLHHLAVAQRTEGRELGRLVKRRDPAAVRCFFFGGGGGCLFVWAGMKKEKEGSDRTFLCGMKEEEDRGEMGGLHRALNPHPKIKKKHAAMTTTHPPLNPLPHPPPPHQKNQHKKNSFKPSTKSINQSGGRTCLRSGSATSSTSGTPARANPTPTSCSG